MLTRQFSQPVFFHCNRQHAALPRQYPVCPLGDPRRHSIRSRKHFQVVSWGFSKQLGFQKPKWLPDFGLKKRQATLERFFGPIKRETYEELLSPTFFMVEEGNEHRKYSREGKCSYKLPPLSLPPPLSSPPKPLLKL